MQILCPACGRLGPLRADAIRAEASGVTVTCGGCGHVATLALAPDGDRDAEAEGPSAPDPVDGTPGSGAGAPPPVAPPDGDGEDDDAARAWRALEASWEDDAAHRRYLDLMSSLGDLAEAGRRYRERAERSPGDERAHRGKELVLKRAMALAFTRAPRTVPKASSGRTALFALAALLLLVGLGAAALLRGAPR